MMWLSTGMLVLLLVRIFSKIRKVTHCLHFLDTAFAGNVTDNAPAGKSFYEMEYYIWKIDMMKIYLDDR